MSKENVKKFMEEIKNNKELQEKIVVLSKNEQEVSEKDIVALAEGSGFTFTVDELKEVAEEKKNELIAEGELDDEALEQVAGGLGWGMALLSGFTVFIGCGIALFVSETQDSECTNF